MDGLSLTWLLPIGFGAGFISTLAGMGGGFLLVLGLSLISGPRMGLALSAPALVLGNLHRFWLFRDELDRGVMRSLLVGGVPGAVIGALLTSWIDPAWIPWMMLAASVFAVARGLEWIRWAPGRRALVPAGAIAGTVTAAAGTGALIPPLLLASGVRGAAFVATAAATSALIHVARVLGYAIGGLLSWSALAGAVAVAAGIWIGNLTGRRLRQHLGETIAHRLTYVVLVLTVLLALAGVA